MKTLYLVRHGNANDGLTPEGVKEITLTAAELKKEIGSIEDIVIYYGPLNRTRESAELIAAVFNPSKVYMEPKNELSCNMHAIKSIVDKINSICIIVSHRPDLESYLQSQGIYEDLDTAEYKKLEF